MTGLEPSTNYPYNAVAEKVRGRVKLLAPGETTVNTVDIDFLLAAADIDAVWAEIAGISGGREPVIEPLPIFAR